MSEPAEWKRCSSCKKPIAFVATYYVCSVSTCTRKRTGFVFCSVECWEIHLPMMRHREAGAVEMKAPTREEWRKEQAGDGGGKAKKTEAKPSRDGPVRRRVASPKREAPPGPREVLVIASRLKTYIREQCQMNTSDGVLEMLSDHIRRQCLRAARKAQEAGRRTVLDRDFDFLER